MWNTQIAIHHYLILSTVLFCIGLVGVLVRRNSLVMLMCVELMLSAVNLLLVAFSKMHPEGDAAQLFVLFIMIVSAAEVTIGLAIIVLLYRHKKSVDADILNQLRDEAH